MTSTTWAKAGPDGFRLRRVSLAGCHHGLRATLPDLSWALGLTGKALRWWPLQFSTCSRTPLMLQLGAMTWNCQRSFLSQLHIRTAKQGVCCPHSPQAAGREPPGWAGVQNFTGQSETSHLRESGPSAAAAGKSQVLADSAAACHRFLGPAALESFGHLQKAEMCCRCNRIPLSQTLPMSCGCLTCLVAASQLPRSDAVFVNRNSWS